MIDIHYFERPNNVALFLDDALGKIAAQKLPDIDANGVAIGQRRRAAHRRLAHHDRAIRVDHFQHADALVVIAEDLEQNVAARSRRKQDVVFFEHARIVRDEILRLRGFELKSAAHGTGAPAQIEQIHLAVVPEKNLVFERGLDLRPGL